jgi:sulfur carrier protein ThiS
LTDYQIEPVGGNGWLRLYQFYPSQNEIRALTYSPYLNQYDTSTYGQFVLSLDMSITPGDVNNDGIVDILDVVKTVNFVLGKVIPSSAEFEAADCNKDDNIDVLDVVRIVNIVLGRV